MFAVQVLTVHRYKANKLSTVKKCLNEVLKYGGPFNPRDLYPVCGSNASESFAHMTATLSQYQLALHQIDSMRKDGKFIGVDGTIPEGDFYRPREYTEDGKAKPLVPKYGNALIVQLGLDGMKLQPCRPSFFDARDAIIAADKTLTGGENFCDLWEGFASRGLGVDAKVEGRTPWGGGVRTNVSFLPLASCLWCFVYARS